MDVKIVHDNGGNWISGTVSNSSNSYIFSVKIFAIPSDFGINNGYISKLSIHHANKPKCLVNYDREWDLKPETKELEDLTNYLIRYLENNNLTTDGRFVRDVILSHGD